MHRIQKWQTFQYGPYSQFEPSWVPGVLQPVIHRLEERELLHLGAFSYEMKETAWHLSSVNVSLTFHCVTFIVLTNTKIVSIWLFNDTIP